MRWPAKVISLLELALVYLLKIKDHFSLRLFFSDVVVVPHGLNLFCYPSKFLWKNRVRQYSAQREFFFLLFFSFFSSCDHINKRTNRTSSTDCKACRTAFCRSSAFTLAAPFSPCMMTHRVLNGNYDKETKDAVLFSDACWVLRFVRRPVTSKTRIVSNKNKSKAEERAFVLFFLFCCFRGFDHCDDAAPRSLAPRRPRAAARAPLPIGSFELSLYSSFRRAGDFETFSRRVRKDKASAPAPAP